MANERSPWTAITLIGVLCGITLGAIIVMLVRGGRRGDLELGDGGLGELGPMFAPPRQLRSLPKRQAAAARSRPIARTLTIGNTEPTAILKAVGTRDWKVFVRVVGPPGSSAQFMVSSSLSDSLTLEGGDFQEMRIPSGEFLYAQGNTPGGVLISASGGEEA